MLAPIFNEMKMGCTGISVDTDEFGTFSGEVERHGSVKDTLRKKIQAGSKLLPKARLILASEGSFVPDPYLGFLQCDLEALLLWDKKLEIEVYAEYLCRNPIHAEAILAPGDDFRRFLSDVRFPDHGVIVHPHGSLNPIFKGLHEERRVAQAILDCFVASKTGKVVLATDLRANHSPTRQNAIYNAGKNLAEKICSSCPECRLPGFAITKGIPGLVCIGCGEPSQVAAKVQWSCIKCEYSEERVRPDGKSRLEPEECENCNP